MEKKEEQHFPRLHMKVLNPNVIQTPKEKSNYRVPRYLRGYHQNTVLSSLPQASAFSYVQIGGDGTDGFNRPGFHGRKPFRDNSKSPSKLIERSIPIQPQDTGSIRYGIHYFVETDNQIGVLNEQTTFKLPEHKQKSRTSQYYQSLPAFPTPRRSKE